VPYDSATVTENVRRSCAVAGFCARRRWGALRPIRFSSWTAAFGLDAGEQILSSHSAIEGTMELPDLSASSRS
jgi:hypothetical protein